MNFKKYYINGNKWSIYITFRNKSYNIEVEHWWNNLMYDLFIFTSIIYHIKEENGYFSVYRKYLFSNNNIGNFINREEAIKYIKNLRRKENKNERI